MVEIFQVGGSIRDKLMGRDPQDFDFVVVGGTVEYMLANGLKQVGADFPVFIHPNGDEYALARTERKTGSGYTGFECFTENVTLEQDLRRRDLTINAIAYDQMAEQIIDPFGGESDIKKKVLRHVDADAFREDPVRVLRLARFLARWPDFNVDNETRKLCEQMVKDGELAHLTAERVTAELFKALGEASPTRFFIFLQSVGALAVVLPEVAALHGVPQPFKWHPEGCCFTHTMLVLDEAANSDVSYRPFSHAFPMSYYDARVLLNWCALVHDLGKATTPADVLPSHHGHEERGARILQKLCDRLKIANIYREVGAVVCHYHTHVHDVFKLNAKTLAHMYGDNHRLFSNPELTWVFCRTSWCDTHGRGPFSRDMDYPNATCMEEVMAAMRAVKARDLLPEHVLKDHKNNKNKIIQTVFTARRQAASAARAKCVS